MKYLLLLILLIGCSNDVITCTNSTTIREVVQVKEIEIPCHCSECPKCDICYNVTDVGNRKLEMCNMVLDNTNDELFKCLQQNNTFYLENLTDSYNDCIEERDECKDILHNITEWLK